MRRAVLATFLCVVTLPPAAAHASPALLDRVALREVLRQQARTSAGGRIPLPLPQRPRTSMARAPRGLASMGDRDQVARASRELASRVPRGLASIADSDHRERVLVGVRAHGQLTSVAAALRGLGAEPEVFDLIGVLAASVPSTAVARLADDPRVAYVERDRVVRLADDPFDVVDPLTGIKFTWAYDFVRAGEALAAAGGGSRRTIAVIDTGLDVNHPEFAGRIERTFDTATGRRRVTDFVGHGTFVTGLISAVDGNGIGGKGVAGTTKVIAVRGSTDGEFRVADVIRGIYFSVGQGADVLNLSLAGRGFGLSQARALEGAFISGVLPVAASGNNALKGNPLEYPAAALGGNRGGRGIGLSVAAVKPDGTPPSFSNHNPFVSLAAPGAGSTGCQFGVFSALPANPNDWDNPRRSCSLTFLQGAIRFAYGEGTSFAAPIAAGIAALTWQVEPRLASEQVADVLVRSARQTFRTGWNEFTGSGVVDGQAAAALARAYDVTAPRVRARARRRGARIAVRVRSSKDRTEPGRELAGGVTYRLFVSRNGGRSFRRTVRGRKPFGASVRIRGPRANVVAVAVCDGNGNCGVKRLGRFRLG